MYKLFRKFYADNRRPFLWTAAIFLALQSFVSVICRNNDADVEFGMTMIVYGLWLVCMAMLNMRAYYDRKTAVAAMTLPVPQWRKYLFAWANSFVAGSAVFVVLFFAAKLFAMPFPVDERAADYTAVPDYYNAVFPIIAYSAAMFICSFSVGAPYKWYAAAVAAAVVLPAFGTFVCKLVFNGIIAHDSDILPWVFFPSKNMYTALSMNYYGDSSFVGILLRPFEPWIVKTAFCAVWSAVMFAAGYFKFTERQLK